MDSLDNSYAQLSSFDDTQQNFIPTADVVEGFLSTHGEIDRQKRKIEEEIREFSSDTGIFISSDERSRLIGIMASCLKINGKVPIQEGMGRVASPREFLDIAKLRYDVFLDADMAQYFPTNTPGMLFDDFDARSILVRFKEGDRITGSIGLIKDVPGMELKSEKDVNFSQLRFGGGVAELNRLVIDPKYQGNKREFYALYDAIAQEAVALGVRNVTLTVRSIHFPMYERFGGVTKLATLDTFKDVTDWKSDVLNWQPAISRDETEYFQERMMRWAA